ncbi:MAG: twin-arginine translocase TatA/TatE family subunit [Fidelibacterota bacterium]
METYQVVQGIFNLGPWEIVLILLVILLLFGAKRLPELARSLGKGITEFKGALNETTKEIKDAADSVESKQPEDKESD